MAGIILPDHIKRNDLKPGENKVFTRCHLQPSAAADPAHDQNFLPGYREKSRNRMSGI